MGSNRLKFAFLTMLLGVLCKFYPLHAQSLREIIEVRLLADHQELAPGTSGWLGVEVNLAPGWHVYWKESGESGYPTTVTWELPAGIEVAELQYPEPTLYSYDGLSGYILKNSFILLTEFSISPDAVVEPGTSLTFQATLDALVCSESTCLPFNQELSVSLPLVEVAKPDPVIRAQLQSAYQSLSQTPAASLPAVETQVSPSLPKRGDQDLSVHGFTSLWAMLGLVIIGMSAWAYGKSLQSPKGKPAHQRWLLFSIASLVSGIWVGYPASSAGNADGGLVWEKWTQSRQDKLLGQGRAVYVDYTAKWCLSCQVNKRVYNEPEIIALLKEKEVVLLRADWTQKGSDILHSLQSLGREGVPLYVFYPAGSANEPILLPEILTAESVLQALVGQQAPSLATDHGFWAIMGFAWLGGLILNLMPCVFPVIGLKVMSFVKQAGEEPGRVIRHGWVFTLGVVLSFWGLLGALLFLRQRLQEDLGWGFQLQEPAFVFFLAVLLFLFALSLSGVFEIGMGLTGKGSGLTQKTGYAGSFFSGVLATVVATPCMAPFLGVAIGAALAMELLPAFLVFTSIAIGLSSPYLVLSLFPQWISHLPRPGAWMDTLKQFMAFPLYATVAWLLWTFAALIQ